MRILGKSLWSSAGFGVWVVAGALSLGLQGFAQAPAAKTVGTVKSVSGNSIVITSDAGAETSVTFTDTARIVKAEPGQTDLKSAAPIQVSDIQIGDRIIARGQAGENGSLVASSAIVMKKTDIAQRQQTERDEWRRGVGGIVKSVDGSSGTITIANSLVASGKPITVHVSPQTDIRRYAPNSIRFDDARPSSLSDIRPDDQLLARGTKSADGTEFTAQAIVTGAFREIAGTVLSTDVASGTLSLTDLGTKQPLVVKVGKESELHKLPPFVAARLAMRLKGVSTDAASGDYTASPNGKPDNATTGQGGGNRGAWQGRSDSVGGGAHGEQGGQRGNWRGGAAAGGDPQQMLSRMPTISISDLNKGDAVMLVTTEGEAAAPVTVIKLFAGVEPLLTAAPQGAGASMILSPWNLGAGQAAAGGDAATQ